MSGMTELTEQDKDWIAKTIRVEVRFAIRDLYDRMSYDGARSTGTWQEIFTPRHLDYDWVYERHEKL